MWYRQACKYLFSEQSFKSSFQIRSKLSEFFKHTHPDTNQNAPETIKQENLRSLKNLNAYIDSLLQSKPIEAKLLKFYISQKSNMKSKKFYSFEVELPQVKSNNNNQLNDKTLTNVIQVLNSKFLETRMLRNPLLKKELNKEKKKENVKKQTEQERLKRIQSEIRPYKQRRRSVTQQFQQLMNEKIKTSIKNAQRDTLVGQLQKKVLLANTPANKPLMWSRIAMKKSGLYSNYQEILSKIIDPNLVYLNEDLTQQQIDQFKKTLLPGQQEMKPKAAEEHNKMHKVFLQMEESQPPIFLYVTKHYSAKDMPGFYSIPYNFKPVQLVNNFKNKHSQILSERQKYESYYDTIKSLASQLQRQNNLLLELTQFKNNSDIARKVLMAKRLTHYRSESEIFVVPFDDLDYKYFCQQYKVDNEITCHRVGNKIITKIQFSDQDLKNTLQNASQ